MLETKILPVTAIKSAADGRTLSGHCSVKNNVDSYGDIILDGAYDGLYDAVKSGFICANHDHSTPIGFFTRLEEDENGLYFEAKFHSTEHATEWLTIVSERLDNDKIVGLSIGYKTMDYEFGQVDGEAVRMLKKILVKEATITLLPANDEAKVLAYKSRNDHFNIILSNIAEYKTRLEEISKLGRGESFANKSQDELLQLKSAVQTLEETINSFVQTPEVLGTDGNEQKSQSIAIALAELEM